MDIRVLIADDHSLFREGLHKIIELEEDIIVQGEAVDGDEAIRKAEQLNPDIVLLDINMPGSTVENVVREIKALGKDIAVVLLTVHNEVEMVINGIRCGANGYAMKDIEILELVKGLRKVMKGDPFIQDCLKDKVLIELIKLFQKGLNDKKQYNSIDINLLTDREREVLSLVGGGLSNKAISDKLYISEKTVKNHVSSIFQKLSLKSRAEAAACVARSELGEL